jgi:1,2-dihydroxy-3-keto-5-methylthiopentene dioxygenase
MARVFIHDEKRELTDVEEIRAYLEPHGIWYEKWDVAGRIDGEASSEEILSEYAPEIQRLQQTGGYTTADVINVNPGTPNLDAMLEKFSKEHTHSEDEVRFTVKGHGVFHIHPENGPVFGIEIQAGDLINVPAGTRHWFDLCSDKTIRCIRLFLDPSGWAPHYIEQGVHSNYMPVCLGPTFVPSGEGVKSPVNL